MKYCHYASLYGELKYREVKDLAWSLRAHDSESLSSGGPVSKSMSVDNMKCMRSCAPAPGSFLGLHLQLCVGLSPPSRLLLQGFFFYILFIGTAVLVFSAWLTGGSTVC